MKYDCAIVGGGPAGLNAALVLGRGKKSVALFDNGQPRNAVTHASHGFITRDGVTPSEFRRIAYGEVLSYPTVRHWQDEITGLERTETGFLLRTASGEQVEARKLILAAGLKEELPEIEGIRDFYGSSIFNCPFCDGWENRDRPLAIISDNPSIFHRVKLLYNWTKDLIVCTNGNRDLLTPEQRQQLESKGIPLIETSIAAFAGHDGMLERIDFTDGTSMKRSGALIDPVQLPKAGFEEALGYEVSDVGAIVTDAMGRTGAAGVFAAGDAAYVMPSQLIYAAASGSKAAVSVMAELTEEDWNA